MKFAKQLREKQHAEWAEVYVDYKYLKKVLNSLHGPDVSQTFCGHLAEQVNKVVAFMSKQQDIIAADVSPLVPPSDDGVPSIVCGLDCQLARARLKATCESLIQKIEMLRSYTALNEEALRKIVKKFDKRFSISLYEKVYPATPAMPYTSKELQSWLLAPACRCLKFLLVLNSDITRPLLQFNFWVTELSGGCNLLRSRFDALTSTDPGDTNQLLSCRFAGKPGNCQIAVKNTFIDGSVTPERRPRSKSLPRGFSCCRDFGIPPQSGQPVNANPTETLEPLFERTDSDLSVAGHCLRVSCSVDVPSADAFEATTTARADMKPLLISGSSDCSGASVSSSSFGKSTQVKSDLVPLSTSSSSSIPSLPLPKHGAAYLPNEGRPNMIGARGRKVGIGYQTDQRRRSAPINVRAETGTGGSEADFTSSGSSGLRRKGDAHDANYHRRRNTGANERKDAETSLAQASSSVATLDPAGSPKNNSQRWWTESVGECPLSNFPIRLLPYPPFRFRLDSNSSSRHLLVDGQYLVLHVFATWQFEALGRPLSQSDISALDTYIKRCKLGPWRLAEAWDLSLEGTPDSREKLEAMRRKARTKLVNLQHIQQRRKQSVHPEAIQSQ